MVKMDNVVRCYRGVDPVEGDDMLYAVKNGLLAPSTYTGEHNSWLTADGFGRFDEWASTPDEHDGVRLAMLDQFELLWEKQE